MVYADEALDNSTFAGSTISEMVRSATSMGISRDGLKIGLPILPDAGARMMVKRLATNDSKTARLPSSSNSGASGD